MTLRIRGSKRSGLARHLAVAITGVGTAVALIVMSPADDAKSALAATHCTRYAPVVSVDTNCSVDGRLWNSGYQTPSNAWRDTNHITFTYTSRCWHLRYDDNTGPSASGCSQWGSLWTPSPYQLPARCSYSGSLGVYANCYTVWHD